MLRLRMLFVLLVIVILATCPANAADLGEMVEFHGFGEWGYGQTDHNVYLGGNEDGNYNNFQFALALAAKPAKDLQLKGQFNWKENNDDANVTEIDYAFAEWFFADALILRIGKVKQPFGIYNEVYDVGTMRPFFYLPQSYYGPSGFNGKSYKGLGFTGSLYTPTGWGVEYDLYGGSLDADLKLPYHVAYVVSPTMTGNVTLPSGKNAIELYQELLSLPVLIPCELKVRDAVGGRVVGHTPFNLSVGFSAITGKIFKIDGYESLRELSGQGYRESQMKLYGTQLEYIYKILTLRSEWGMSEAKGMGSSRVGYGELSLRPIPHWEVAGRYDWLEYEIDDPVYDKDAAPSLSKHSEWAAGINYWFNSNFVIKLSYHNIYGNRFALPETISKVAEKKELKKKTQLVVGGAQFSF